MKSPFCRIKVVGFSNVLEFFCGFCVDFVPEFVWSPEKEGGCVCVLPLVANKVAFINKLFFGPSGV